MKKVLITGASGFVGGFLVEKALNKGYEVYAVVRKTSSRQYLTDPRINFIELNLLNQERLNEQLVILREEKGTFDYVIHGAGITKANNNAEFFSVNTEITRKLVNGLIETNFVSDKFVFVSSLAAAGPGPNREETIKIDQEPSPVTSYGKSKLEAENFLSSTTLDHIILRPTAVFGPRDTELFTLFNLINKNLEFYIGTDQQKLSFIYVKDLVEMTFAAMESTVKSKTYLISDGNNYLIKDFINTIKTSLDKKTFKVIVPAGIVSVVAFILEKVLGVFGKVPALNSEKMAELTAENWTCDMTHFFDDFSYRPKYDLQTAVTETAEWYKNENWI